MNTITDEQRRLAGAMGVDPDDPLITVLKPVADLAEEMKARGRRKSGRGQAGEAELRLRDCRRLHLS